MHGKWQGYIDLLAQQHPNLVTLREIGRSWQGRPLKVLEITSPSGNVAEKPCIFLEGGIHSREWIATSTVLYIAGVGRAIRHKVFGLKVVGGIIL